MNPLFFAFWFLQELRIKNNDIESEEEKNMEDARWKANRIVNHGYNKYINSSRG